MKIDALLLNSLKKFYSEEYNKAKLLMALNDSKMISLRSIDWFITNYSKKNKINYPIYQDNNSGFPSFNKGNNLFKNNMSVFPSYKSQLKAYSKKKFDPFCRRDRIMFNIDNNTTIETTIGQLNFFRWAISNLIIDYIIDHKKSIEDDMNNSLKEMKNKYLIKGGERKKRQELSLSATRGLSMNHFPIELNFT